MPEPIVPAGRDRGWMRQPGLWLAAAVFLAHAWWLRGLAEDAFISFRFARHLAQGFGLRWNVGDAPIEGYTNFLWVIFEAAGFKLGADPVWLTPLAGVALGLAMLALVYRTLLVRLGLHERTAAFSVMLLAAAGPFATWATSGMETLLFTCLVWVAFDAVLARRSAPAASALVLATLTRPEGALVAVLLLGGYVAVGARGRAGKAFTRPVIVAVAGYVIVVAAYGALCWRYFGWPLPNTFYAKTGGSLEQWLRGVLLTGHFLFDYVVPLVPWLFVLMWAGGATTWQALRRDLIAGGRWTAVVLAALIIAGYTAYIVAVGGDYMAMHRFFVVLMPFWYLLLGCLTEPIQGPPIEPHSYRRQAINALTAWSLLATFVHSTPIDTLLFVKASQQHGNYQGVQLERWHVARLTVIGRFFDGYRATPADSLGTAAVGAIGYYADMPILDFHGIVDAHIAHAAVPDTFGWRRPGHERHDWGYVLDRRPTYLMFSRDLTPTPGSLDRYLPREITPDLKARLYRDYETVSVWLTDPVNREAGYFTFFRRRLNAT